jgi:dephospho-CoA kinase
MTFSGASSRPASSTGAETRVRLLALVGMPGAGKSLLATHLRELGFPTVRFGQITIDEVVRRDWEVNPENERIVRNEIREMEGMDAYARRSLPYLRASLHTHASAIIDGLYSFSEYKTLKAEFGTALVVVAVTCDRALRYARLGRRPERPLTPQEAERRDISEIEALEKGGPIAIADYTLLNNGAPAETIAALDALLAALDLRP